MNLTNKHHPKYEPEKWNQNVYLRKSHNCYSYALNLIYPKLINDCKKLLTNTKQRTCRKLFVKPGIYAGIQYTRENQTGKKIEKLMLQDNPFMKKIKKNGKCPDGYYRIALVFSSSGKGFHYYRQDNTGLWSHKDGWTKATNKDKKGRLIKNIEQADRGSYDQIIGYYIIPNNSNKKFMGYSNS